MTGIAGLNFINDFASLIRTKWVSNSGGKLPGIVSKWNIKTVGHGESIYDQIILALDGESSEIFSLLQGEPNRGASYDWLHGVDVSIDIRSGESERRVLQLTNEVMRIIKSNVVPTINKRTYLQLLPTGVTSLNEQYRNLYRYSIGVETLIFNP